MRAEVGHMGEFTCEHHSLSSTNIAHLVIFCDMYSKTPPPRGHDVIVCSGRRDNLSLLVPSSSRITVAITLEPSGSWWEVRGAVILQ